MTVLRGVKGFDWDLHNVGHVDRHGVSPTEVEEAFERPHAIIPARDVSSEKRWKLFGTSAAGRYLVEYSRFGTNDCDLLRPIP